jgi:CheY-like chemotaxis protein
LRAATEPVCGCSFNPNILGWLILIKFSCGLNFAAGIQLNLTQMNDGPVYVVDDDDDDLEIIKEVWQELGYKNELRFFSNAESVLRQIKNEPVVPFLIICDVNVPKMGGFELKRQVMESETLYYKSIPFVFWSTQASKEQIKKAYDLRVNGFFIKENRIADVKASLATIMEYWFKSAVPE